MRSPFSFSSALAAFATLSVVTACSYDFDRFVPLETTGTSTTASGDGAGAGGSRTGASGGAAGSSAGGAAGTSGAGAGGSAGAADMDAAVDSRPMNDGGTGADSDVADRANEAAIDVIADARPGEPDVSNDVAAESAPPDAGCVGDACGACPPPADCSCETYNGHTYRFCTMGGQWGESESQCATAGMRLARVDDAPENGFIRTTADAHGMGEVWIGIEDPTNTFHWQWPDGTEFWNGSASGGPVGGLYNNWGANKPSGNSNRDCASMLTSAFAGTWSDRSCTSVLPYVCERYP